MDWPNASAADRTCAVAKSSKCPNERNPILSTSPPVLCAGPIVLLMFYLPAPCLVPGGGRIRAQARYGDRRFYNIVDIDDDTGPSVLDMARHRCRAESWRTSFLCAGSPPLSSRLHARKLWQLLGTSPLASAAHFGRDGGIVCRPVSTVVGFSSPLCTPAPGPRVGVP